MNLKTFLKNVKFCFTAPQMPGYDGALFIIAN